MSRIVSNPFLAVSHDDLIIGSDSFDPLPGDLFETGVQSVRALKETERNTFGSVTEAQTALIRLMTNSDIEPRDQEVVFLALGVGQAAQTRAEIAKRFNYANHHQIHEGIGSSVIGVIGALLTTHSVSDLVIAFKNADVRTDVQSYFQAIADALAGQL